MDKNTLLDLIDKVGFPILSSLFIGYCLFIAIKIILNDTKETLKKIHNIIFNIDSKLNSISMDVQILDILISDYTNLPQDKLKKNIIEHENRSNNKNNN
jgi:hypothetical protein